MFLLDLADELCRHVLARLEWTGAAATAWRACRRLRVLTDDAAADGAAAARPPGFAWAGPLLPAGPVAGWCSRARPASDRAALARLCRLYRSTERPGHLRVTRVAADVAADLLRGLRGLTSLDLAAVPHVTAANVAGHRLEALALGDDPGPFEPLAETISRLPLRRLALRGTAVDAAPAPVQALLARLPRLTDLDLSYNGTVEPAEFERLVDAIRPLPLRRLDLAANYLGCGASAQLARGLPATLETLEISRNYLGEAPDAAVELARAIARLPRLTRLDLADNCLGESDPPAARSVLQALADTRLRHLDLSENELGLVEPVPLPRPLETLDLRHNQLTAAQLAGLDPPAGLVRLALCHNCLGSCAGALDPPDLPRLETLGLANNALDGRTIGAVVARLPRLTSLDVGRNPLGELGRVLVGAPGLRVLSASSATLNAPASGLAAADQLCELDLSTTYLSRAVEALPAGLTVLRLTGNHLGARAHTLQHVADALAAMPLLEELHLGRNCVGHRPDGCRQLTGGLARLERLRILSLRENKIPHGEGDVAALVQAVPGTLATLDLGANAVGLWPGDLGVLVAWVLRHPRRVDLNLTHNRLDDVPTLQALDLLCDLTARHNPATC